VTDAAELIEVNGDVEKTEDAAETVKIYVMVAAEVGIEDAKQGMNGTEKDAKKSARERVKDKRKKRGRALAGAGKTKGAPKQTSTREILIILPRHVPSSTGRASMELMDLKKRSKLRGEVG